REKRMLFAIEKATRQPIEKMQLPSTEDIADRRVMQFTQMLSETIESQDLSFFQEVIAHYQESHDADPLEVAAALTYLVQKTRPLKPVVHVRPPRAEREQGSRRDRSDRSERPNRSERTSPRRGNQPERHRSEDGMQTYRVEVGRTHGVEVKNIVGAIANEAGIDSKDIGRISLQDEYSTVDLPEGMPKDLFQQLRKVWVCNKQLELSLVNSNEASGSESRRKPKRSGKPRTRARDKARRPSQNRNKD
ncbi:MAG: ATP-dependent helicase, partial [Gammaproteobacteria bacterium]